MAAQLAAADLLVAFQDSGIQAFYGVPDSTLSSFGFCLQDGAGSDHVIAANEGNAVGLAIGHYLGTRQPALVYLQNSGLGNAINPLVSLADPQILGIPVVLLIGWRGRPEVPDEPQHLVQGAVTEELLRTLGIPFDVLSPGAAPDQIRQAVEQAKRRPGPAALLVPPGLLENYSPPAGPDEQPLMSREEAIKVIISQLQPSDAVIATTGKISRELYEYRRATGHQNIRDLLVVGGMGHASSIAQGLALARPARRVICLDGDGAALMHLGALASIGATGPANLFQIVLNNGVHESVGGQPTAHPLADLAAIARDCGYQASANATTAAAVKSFLAGAAGPAFLNLQVRSGSRPDLSRPSHTPAQNKQNLVEFLQE
jgi:phosphonopyruvate decarboxylase